MHVHPCSKVIGIYFVVSNDGIYFQCIDLFFYDTCWGLLHSLWKISWVYVTAARMCEHSNPVRFEKRAAKTLQHGYRYCDILMLYDIITTYVCFSAIIDTNYVLVNIIRPFQHILFSGQIRYLNDKHEWALPYPLLCWHATSGAVGRIHFPISAAMFSMMFNRLMWTNLFHYTLDIRFHLSPSVN